MKEQLIPPVGDFTISEIQKERGNVYGKFSEQAEFVGRMIHEFEMVAVRNNTAITHKQRGAVAYIAIKLARYAVTPNHKDTLTDLMIYCKLIRQMETDTDCKMEDINA